MEMQILETPITWKIIEKDLQIAFHSKSQLDPQSMAKTFGQGCGFLSKSFVLDLKWIDDSEDLMPKKGLIKICMVNPMEGDNLTPDLLNDNEILFYTQGREALPKSVPIPRYYCGRLYDKELGADYILLEFIEGLTLCHVYHNLQESGILKVIEKLADITVEGLKNPQKLQAIKVIDAWEKCSKDVADLKAFEGRFIKMIQLFPHLTTKINLIKSKVPLIFASSEHFLKLREESSPIHLLSHGDLWTPNILFTKDEKGDYHLRALVDWQLFNLATPVEDLANLLYSAPAPNDIQRIPFYLRRYYDLVKDKVDEDLMPWKSFEVLSKQFEIAYVYMVLIVHPMNAITLEEMIVACKEEDVETCRANFALKIDAITDELCRCLEKWF